MSTQSKTTSDRDQYGDRRDEFSFLIDAAHPTNTDDHETYALAMKMVGNRHSKGALVDLVNWLLTMRKK